MAYISVSLKTKPELKFENSDSSQSQSAKRVLEEQAVIRAAVGVKKKSITIYLFPLMFLVMSFDTAN